MQVFEGEFRELVEIKSEYVSSLDVDLGMTRDMSHRSDDADSNSIDVLKLIRSSTRHV